MKHFYTYFATWPLKASALFFVISTTTFAQFKQVVKPASTVDVAKLINAEVVDNENLKTRKSNQQRFGLVAENRKFPSLTNHFSDLKIQRDADNRPICIEGKLKPNTKNAQARLSHEAVCLDYLENLKDVLQLKRPSEEFSLKTTETDELSHTHTRLQQTYRGLPVYGGEVMLHADRSGEISVLNGHTFPTPDIQDVTPKFSAEQAAQLALQNIGKEAIVKTMGNLEKKILNYDKPTAELIVYHPNNNISGERLAWQLSIRPNFLERWQYVVDAKTGEILDKFNHTCAIDGPTKATAADLNGVQRSIDTYLAQGRYYLIDATRVGPDGKALFKPTQSKIPDDPIGVIWTIDASNTTVDDISVKQVSSTNNAWSNATAVSAHYNAVIAYEYYKNTHKRSSLNGRGGTILSIINITDEDGKGFDNAFWNGEFMGYGNGRTAFRPLAGGLDVAGHEMTHGVIENSANLEYKGQAGAINESMADIFGAMIDRDDWKMGEDIVKVASYPTGALRDLSNPNNGGRSLNDAGYQPATMSQYYSGSQDNYGVHVNSGIPNFAFYKFATAINAKDKAEKVYYRALTTYLTKTSNFLDLRLAVIKSATDLYGASATEVQAAKSAFDAVGIVEQTQSTPTPSKDIPANTGQEFILSYDPVQKALYVSNTAPKTASDFRAVVSNVTVKHKPSVTDNGQYAYFVASDGKIKRVNLTIASPTVENISSDAVWDNVAISKDGKRLAALTTDADKSIYIFNLSATPVTSKKFVLYNPTYSGVQTGQVLYADALEWDHAGEYVVYDAFNKLKAADGTEADFWDVGFLEAWDNSKNTFGTGDIDKLFTDLDKGESIGNPSFSKNSTDILSFDYYDAEAETYYILGVNTETSAVGFVVENNTIGYPDYSRQDNRIVYNNKVSSKENTNIITLKTDKVSATGSTSLLIQDSKWAVWYATGTRQLPQKQVQTISFSPIPDKVQGVAPFNLTATASSGLPVSFAVTSGPATVSGSQVTITGIGKVEIMAYQEGNTQFGRAVSVTVSFNVNAITGIEPRLSAEQVVVFPNPVGEQLTVRLPFGVKWKSISLNNLSGQKMTEVNYQPSNEVKLDVKSFSSGFYLLEVKTEETTVWKKVLKL